MGWLARREYSRQELITKLVRKGCAASMAAEMADALQAERLLSDERFTESLTRVRRERGVGPLRIQKELQEKGVAESVVSQWLDPTDKEWLGIIRSVRRKRFGEALPENQRERARQARFLQYRGFSYDQIRRAFDLDDWE